MSPDGRVSGRRAHEQALAKRVCGRQTGRADAGQGDSPRASAGRLPIGHTVAAYRPAEGIQIHSHEGPGEPSHPISHRYTMSIEDYDFRLEEVRLRALNRDLALAEKQGLAEQAALRAHPVVSHILNEPIESTEYPAIEYLILAQQTGRSVLDIYSDVQAGKTCFIDTEGNHCFYRPVYHEYMHWTMPGHDTDRPLRKGCGMIHSRSGGLVYTSCPDHPEHFCQAKRLHCWSPRCPQCFNDKALKQGVKAEEMLLAYKELHEGEGEYVGDIGHWVVSPPQEVMKSLMQTRDEYMQVLGWVYGCLQMCGATAGITVFHPWREQNERWLHSPHFHNLCYGYIDTDRFLRMNPGWIIKKVHPDEKIRSIRHNAAYLYTHQGLAYSEVDPDDVDWDLDFLNYMIPGLKSEGADYEDEDYEHLLNDKGRMAGDLSDFDWEDWTMSRLKKEVRIVYWGGVSRNKIRTLDIDRQHKIRCCPECGEILRVFDGIHDSIGNYVRYIQDNRILVLSHQYALIRNLYLRYKDFMRENDITPSDFAEMIPFAISTLQFARNDKDITVSGPFAEPDSFFLRRQKAAYGSDDIIA